MEKPTLVVNISDFKISNNPNDHIVTYSLGSCLGVTVYDPVLRLGGMIHCLLPDSSIGKGKPDFNPAMYVDSGLTTLFRELIERGSNKKNWQIKAAGCGDPASALTEHFNIGNRNFIMLKKILWTNGLILHGKLVGGNRPKTLFLDIKNGTTIVKMGNDIVTL